MRLPRRRRWRSFRNGAHMYRCTQTRYVYIRRGRRPGDMPGLGFPRDISPGTAAGVHCDSPCMHTRRPTHPPIIVRTRAPCPPRPLSIPSHRPACSDAGAPAGCVCVWGPLQSLRARRGRGGAAADRWSPTMSGGGGRRRTIGGGRISAGAAEAAAPRGCFAGLAKRGEARGARPAPARVKATRWIRRWG